MLQKSRKKLFRRHTPLTFNPRRILYLIEASVTPCPIAQARNHGRARISRRVRANASSRKGLGKTARKPEVEAIGRGLEAAGVPILGALEGQATLEGGDVVWLDARTLAVGRGYRTNDEGIRQLHRLLGDCVDELITVPQPHWRGPGDVFHLMSILSPVDEDLAVVYSPLMPVPFRELLLERGIELVEVPDDEFETMGSNVLAVAPRRCLMLGGNPVTRRRLESAGAEVHEFEGEEISRKGCGGPTCLTRPILRAG